MKVGARLIFRRNNIALSVICFFLLGLSPWAHATDPLDVTFPSRGQADRFDYDIGLLKLVMEKSGVPYKFTLNETPYNQDRVLKMVEHGEILTVAAAGFNKQRESVLQAIYIPLQRGILGHRIFITRDPDQFRKVRSLRDLKEITLGSGTGWPDTQIMRSAGLKVEDSNYDSLFLMTDRGRVEGYGRGVHEPFAELEKRKGVMPHLSVDKHIMLVYRFDLLFWVKKDNVPLYKAIKQGLENAYADGSFMDYFTSHPRIRDALTKANMKDRRIIRIYNPYMSGAVAAIPDRYWFDPTKE